MNTYNLYKCFIITSKFITYKKTKPNNSKPFQKTPASPKTHSNLCQSIQPVFLLTKLK